MQNNQAHAKRGSTLSLLAIILMCSFPAFSQKWHEQGATACFTQGVQRTLEKENTLSIICAEWQTGYY